MKTNDQPNDFRPIWLAMPMLERHKLAKRAGVSYKYLQRMSGGFAMPSMDLATKLKKHIPTLDFEGFARAVKLAGRRVR